MLKVLLLIQQLWLTSDTKRPFGQLNTCIFWQYFVFLTAESQAKVSVHIEEVPKDLEEQVEELHAQVWAYKYSIMCLILNNINLHLTSCSRGHCIQTLSRTERGNLQTGLLRILCSNYWMLFSTSFSLFLSLLVLKLDKSTEKNITKQHWKLGVPDYTFPN